jgi:glutamine synthetase
MEIAVRPKDKQELLELIKEHQIEFLRLSFTDINGKLKGIDLPISQLDRALDEGQSIDGSSIDGFARINESDMIAKPNIDTMSILPWRDNVAMMFCDICDAQGNPYEGDPRYVLKKNVEKIRAKGQDFFVGPEVEYFYVKSQSEPEILDTDGYFDLTPDKGSELRRETVKALQKMGIRAELSHHEVAPSQHEIGTRFTDAVGMADNVMRYKMAVKAIAFNEGIYATFMPKPFQGENGSGMHMNQSLFQGDENLFAGQEGLSDTAKYYIAGLLNRIKEITLLLNPTVNSYKRLVPGFEAPVYICWAQANRSALVRVPNTLGRAKATRIELRSADPSCNPYLAFSVMLAAGMEGIDNKLSLADPVEVDMYGCSEAERSSMGIDSLPGSLNEAILLAKDSKFLEETLGSHIYNELILSKRMEWNQYRTQVTPWELQNYI